MPIAVLVYLLLLLRRKSAAKVVSHLFDLQEANGEFWSNLLAHKTWDTAVLKVCAIQQSIHKCMPYKLNPPDLGLLQTQSGIPLRL